MSTYAEDPRIIVDRTLKVGLGVFLLLVLYDGALRKWVFPEIERIIFIAISLIF